MHKSDIHKGSCIAKDEVVSVIIDNVVFVKCFLMKVDRVTKDFKMKHRKRLSTNRSISVILRIIQILLIKCRWPKLYDPKFHISSSKQQLITLMYKHYMYMPSNIYITRSINWADNVSKQKPMSNLTGFQSSNFVEGEKQLSNMSKLHCMYIIHVDSRVSPEIQSRVVILFI